MTPKTTSFFYFRTQLLALLTLSAATACAPESANLVDESVIESNPNALTWVSPSTNAAEAGAAVALTVSTSNPAATVVRFLLDGVEVSACDSGNMADDCHSASMWRATVRVETVGAHVLEARFVDSNGINVSASHMLNIVAVGSLPPLDPSEQTMIPLASPTDGTLTGADALTARGFLDPNRSFHSIFGGIEWSVQDQRIRLRASTPTGSTAAVAQCMMRYGDSIRRWADRYNISRASLLATAITESGCTNPAGSSDGLSSGPTQVTASTCAAVTGLSQSTCRTRMHSNPDFSFEVGARYIASSYQLNQHHNDPPKLAAAYNAGSLRASSANRWHMVVTGNHIDRFVSAYNAYRAWETTAGSRSEFRFADAEFNGENVRTMQQLSATPVEGQTVFVGDWAARDGHFVTFMGGRWEALSVSE
jgi:hypothetical protein